jgi:hypothetical protein
LNERKEKERKGKEKKRREGLELVDENVVKVGAGELIDFLLYLRKIGARIIQQHKKLSLRLRGSSPHHPPVRVLASNAHLG